jgi:hypothetical protein
MARIVLDMPDSEAWALAQFCKRLMPEDLDRRASKHDAGSYGGRDEADVMHDAFMTLTVALREAGFAPR